MQRILMKHLAVIKAKNHNSIALYIFRPQNFSILKYLTKKKVSLNAQQTFLEPIGHIT